MGKGDSAGGAVGASGGMGTSDVVRSGGGVEGATVPYTGSADPSASIASTQSWSDALRAWGRDPNTQKTLQEAFKSRPDPGLPGSMSIPGVSMGSAGGGDASLRSLRFALTPKQSQILGHLDQESARRFLLNQLRSGNMAYGPYSAEQVMAAREQG